MATATDTPASEPTAEVKKNLYEGMFLVDTNKFANDPNMITESILGTLAKVDAQIDVHRPWQDGKLAYQIGRYRKGLHYLVYFQMDPAKSPTLDRQCKLNDHIIRKLVIKHPPAMYDAMVAALTGSGEEEAAAE